jgi:hypothetical protein
MFFKRLLGKGSLTTKEFKEHVAFDPSSYREDYEVFRRQSDTVAAELRRIKIIMAVLVPLFIVCSVYSVMYSVIAGGTVISALSVMFIHKKN